MNNVLEENPYRAGPGLYPPHLAGRKLETQTIDSTIGLLKDKAGRMDRSPFPPLVLVGPRGVGKTVLLARAMEFATHRKIHNTLIDRELLSGPEDELVGHMFPDGLLMSVLGRVDSIGVGIEGAGVNVGLKEPKAKFKTAVPAFLSKQPLLLMLDEAHHCKPDDLNKLFKVTQECMSAKLPIALIIAGTPGLEPLLRKCRATYVERSKSLSINTLSHEEAKEALEVPARDDGRPLDSDALELLLDWSDCYPYFIQMAAVEAWNASRTRDGETISLADAKAALVLSDKERDAFYGNRHVELMERDLDERAVQAAKIIQQEQGGKIKVLKFVRILMERNDGMGKLDAMKIIRDLQEEGFIWLNVDILEPGIPSMFDYIIKEHQAEQQH